jgi:hypothetical protein
MRKRAPAGGETDLGAIVKPPEQAASNAIAAVALSA